MIPDARAVKEGDIARAGRRHSATALAIDPSGVINMTATFLTGLDAMRSRGAMLSLERTAQPWSNARLITQNDELNDFVAAG